MRDRAPIPELAADHFRRQRELSFNGCGAGDPPVMWRLIGVAALVGLVGCLILFIQ
jgi:hypothetical protein